MFHNFCRFSYANSVFVYWVVWFYLRIKTFITNFRGPYVFVCVVTLDIRVDLTFKMMNSKKVLEIEKMYEMSLMKKAAISHYEFFKVVILFHFKSSFYSKRRILSSFPLSFSFKYTSSIEFSIWLKKNIFEFFDVTNSWYNKLYSISP